MEMDPSAPGYVKLRNNPVSHHASEGGQPAIQRGFAPRSDCFVSLTLRLIVSWFAVDERGHAC